MRYESDRKKQTHDKIVAGAARLFRDKGYEASGVDAVMSAAGLTAGGFYAHFKNKDALLAEAIGGCRIDLTGGATPPADVADPFESWVSRYLSPRHRDAPGDGCPLPSLASEIARQPKKVRAAFTAALRSRLEAVEKRLPPTATGPAADRAIEVLASAAGAMLLARAVDDEAFSERILHVMRTAITKNVTGELPAKAGQKRNMRRGKGGDLNSKSPR